MDHTHHAEHQSHSGSTETSEPHKHHDHSSMIDDFRRRFFFSLTLTIPILILSDMIQHWIGYTIDFAGRHYLLFAMGSAIFIYGGMPFLKGIVAESRSLKPGMMTLIAVAITTAFLYSVAITFGLDGNDFYWELATLISIMLLGHWIEMRSVQSTSRSLELLARLLPAEAHMVHGDHIMDVAIDRLKPGDLILIKANEKVPADSIIIEGESYIDESMLTGESRPVKRKQDDRLIGGSINGAQSLKARVTSTGKESYLNKVINLVQEAQATKSKTQHLADRAARYLTFISIGMGTVTFAIAMGTGATLEYSIERMVTIMVIACPHALGLAIPLVVAISTGAAAQKGLLIRNRTAFENSRLINAIVFDKTGTLTEGAFRVQRIESLSQGFAEAEILRLSASLEMHSEHPIARGIVAAAREQGLPLIDVTDFKSLTARGIEGKLDGDVFRMVSPGYLQAESISVPAVETDGSETIVYLLREKHLVGRLTLADAIRPESKDAVQFLQASGVKVFMATGDNRKTADAVSNRLGLDGVYSELLPHQKVEIITDLQKTGHYVAMTGDGVNDAPALAQADVGIAVGAGTDVAAETADIVLVNSNPSDIAALIAYGRATYRKMIQNLIWATGYNVIALPLATGFIPGIAISPAIGAVFMSLSTVVVALNAQLLRRRLR
ncbi:heavy metal translocating P-type ATPase [Leptonema illini]|uniref:Heavy metal translocating P-type ATPase n=1 Tax=Leptonema illini DSM 21528 TaxID=929563 RepID=H2CBN7_9LEPT|nr:heavy metal translocating P-type ATPase [Leptonema illini]EHQ07412.1 heavy metal translocating P-type ATPase [Leptonema illini DSM 21528]